MNYEQLSARARDECRRPDGREVTATPGRIALRNCGLIDPENIYEYITLAQGYRGLAGALDMDPADIIAELRKSGLRGRGGAGYPTAEKWQVCRDAGEGDKYLVCNAIDADRRSRTARWLLEGDPHAVLEGMVIGAYAVGAGQGFICANAGYDTAQKRLDKALEQMRRNSLLGDNILDSDFSFDIEIKTVPVSLVSGEETALIRALEGKPAMPYRRTAYPAVKGIHDRPTLVNNVETFAHVSAIFQNGAAWYAATGTGQSYGTKILTITGDLVNGDTVEVPFGTTLREVLERSGSAGFNIQKVKAVRFGGPTGAFLKPESLDVPLSFEAMKESGGLIGSGTIEVFDDSHCAVEMARDATDYIHEQSCGKCTFCREGSLQMADILKDISENKGRPADLELLLELGEAMEAGSICGLGRTAPNPVISCIRLFPGDFEAHIKDNKCATKQQID